MTFCGMPESCKAHRTGARCETASTCRSSPESCGRFGDGAEADASPATVSPRNDRGEPRRRTARTTSRFAYAGTEVPAVGHGRASGENEGSWLQRVETCFHCRRGITSVVPWLGMSGRSLERRDSGPRGCPCVVNAELNAERRSTAQKGPQYRWLEGSSRLVGVGCKPA